MPDRVDESRISSPSVWQALGSIYALIGPRRRRQLYLTLTLMVVGAGAELVTIGAALPFLALISDPARANEIGVVRTIFDLLGWQAGETSIVQATSLLVGAAIIGAAVRLLLNWAVQAFVFRVGHDLGVAVFSRALRQPYLYHVERNSSEVIAGVEKAQAVLFQVLLPLMQGVVAAFMAIFILALLVAIDPLTASIAAVVMALLYVGLSLATRSILAANSRIHSEAHTQRIKQVQEGLGGIRDILIDRSQPVFEKSFREVDDRLRRAQMVNNFVASSPRMVIEAAAIVLIALLALYMSYQPGGVVRAIPVLGALAIGAQRLLPLLQLIYHAWSRTAGSFRIVLDIADLLGKPQPIVDERELPDRIARFSSAIELDKVGFRYPGGRQYALRDISLDIRKGERIGLLGETGSGKSTLLDLVMGLLEPGAGEIRVDGIALTGAMRRHWQAQIAHVPQFIYLSDSPIAENIAFGVAPGEIDMERVRAAAVQAEIAEFIETLPSAYLTPVGERGVRLSGGQRQRIGIARALYKQASVLILDEATSALDNDTEASVMANLGRSDSNLTILMVAHRLSTLAACDRLIRLKNGRVAEVGRYADLVGESAGSARGSA
ncbi:MAG TPA: ABC transporter ATP-binding protein [Allosphingosinicella sp.]|nr:ABC transporter ATP-binding protein [Allosphingosinicella sp.]